MRTSALEQSSLRLANWLAAEQSSPSQEVVKHEEAIRLDPGHDLAHHNLAVALRELGEMDRANAHYQTAQRLRAQRSGRN